MYSTSPVASKRIRIQAPRLRRASFSPRVYLLARGQESEVLAFLAARSLHTVFLRGLVRDNGLVSHLNRGAFYGCRDAAGNLEGVALIGHAILVEAHSEPVIQAFALLAQGCRQVHLIMGEQERIGLFWKHYAPGGQPPRRLGCEVLLAKRLPGPETEAGPELRLAVPENLSSVMAVQAQMALAESGVDPLAVDPTGFRRRCLRRIENGRVWVLVESRTLIFKCDIMAHTPEAIYLEGIYVNPEERRKGHGLRCLAQLSRNLSPQTESLCLFVNDQKPEALEFYRKAGFSLRSYYRTVFLQQAEQND